MVKVEGKGLINFFAQKKKNYPLFYPPREGVIYGRQGMIYGSKRIYGREGVICGSILISVIFRLKVVLIVSE